MILHFYVDGIDIVPALEYTSTHSKKTAMLWHSRDGRRDRSTPPLFLPPSMEALAVSSHFWAGFWLRGVQS